MKVQQKQIPINIRVPEEMLNYLHTVASKTGCSVAQAIREVIVFHREMKTK
jgi:predicted DNA-binding protein